MERHNDDLAEDNKDFSVNRSRCDSEHLDTDLTLVKGAVVIDQIENKDGTPTMRDLNRYVPKKYATDWKDIGIELGLELGILDVIEKDNPQQSVTCFHKTLYRWCMSTPNATWKSLEVALTNVRRQKFGLDPVDDVHGHSDKGSIDSIGDKLHPTSMKGHLKGKPILRNLSNDVAPFVGNKWYVLGVQLLDDKDVKVLSTIESNYHGDNVTCCTKMFEEWLYTVASANLKQLIMALKSPSVELHDLANKLSSSERSFALSQAYCQPSSNSYSSSSPQTQHTLFEMSVDKNAPTEDSIEFTYLISKVSDMIHQDMKRQTFESMKHALCLVTVHAMSTKPLFSDDHVAEIKKCKNTRELTEKCCECWSWNNYSLLKLIVKKSGCTEAKNELKLFKKKVLAKNKLKDLEIKLVHNTSKYYDAFQRMTVIIDHYYDEITAKEFEEIEQFISEITQLPLPAMQLYRVGKANSVLIEWRIPDEAVHYVAMLAYQNKDKFMQRSFLLLRIAGMEVINICGSSKFLPNLKNKEMTKLRCSDLAESVYIASGETGVAAEEPMTIPDLYSNMFNKKPDEIALQWKDKGQWLHKTYAEYKDLIYNVAKSFQKLGLKPHHVVGILGYNSVEWFASSIGAVFAGGISTGLYTNDSPEDWYYILKDSKATIVVVENCELLKKILKIRDELPGLKAIVQYKGELNKDYPDTYTWTEFLELGKDVKASRSMIDIDSVIKKLRPNQCAILVYTSGTTTYPKGVMLSHDNVTWTTKALMDTIGSDKVEEFTKSTISYLPSTHISGMMLDMFLPIATGGTVYFNPTKDSLFATMEEVHPTNFFATPRGWERIKEKLEGSKVVTDSSEQIKKMLGLDECKYMFVGADLMDPHILKFFRQLKITILEVYGLSETTGPHSTNLKNADKYGHCGSSINGGHTKIINKSKYSEPSLLHLSKPPNQVGEVVCRGRNVFMGYLGMENKTKETIDDEGWLHTGDIGYEDEDGNLHITCRINDLIVMRDGTKVVPVEIEETIKAKVDFLSNVMLTGNLRKFLTCLVTLKCVVNPDTGKAKDDLQLQVIKSFKTLGTDCTTASEVTRIKDKAVYNVIQKGIDEYNETPSLNPALKIHDWKLLSTDFSVHEKELGPTSKLRRPVIENNYASAINELYGNESDSTIKNHEQCPLVEPVSVTEKCNDYGQRIKIQDHNVTVFIPGGAIEKGRKVEITVAASLFGSYEFPKGFSRASPYVWIGANYTFKKPLKIEVEHHAVISKEDDLSNLYVMEVCDKENGESSEDKVCKPADRKGRCPVGSSFYTYYTTSRHTTFMAKSDNTPVEVAVYQCVPQNYSEVDEFTVEINFFCNLQFFRKTHEEIYKKANMITDKKYYIVVKSDQELQLRLHPKETHGWSVSHEGSVIVAASKIIYQTFQGADYITKEMKQHGYPCFRVIVFREQPKAQLKTTFDICVQSEKVISVLNLHVPAADTTTPVDEVGYSAPMDGKSDISDDTTRPTLQLNNHVRPQDAPERYNLGVESRSAGRFVHGPQDNDSNDDDDDDDESSPRGRESRYNLTAESTPPALADATDIALLSPEGNNTTNNEHNSKLFDVLIWTSLTCTAGGLGYYVISGHMNKDGVAAVTGAVCGVTTGAVLAVYQKRD